MRRSRKTKGLDENQIANLILQESQNLSGTEEDSTARYDDLDTPDDDSDHSMEKSVLDTSTPSRKKKPQKRRIVLSESDEEKDENENSSQVNLKQAKLQSFFNSEQKKNKNETDETESVQDSLPSSSTTAVPKLNRKDTSLI